MKGLSPLCLLGALLVLLLGCQPHRPGGRLVVATSARVGSVDPVRASTFGATQLLSAVGDPLYRLAADGAVLPALAAELPASARTG